MIGEVKHTLDSVIVGVLNDFMGYLTTRDKRLICSAKDNASPAVEAIKEFLEMRGVDVSNDEANTEMVKNWNKLLGGNFHFSRAYVKFCIRK